MDIFLSWSTERSKNLASIFNNWVVKVIPQLDVYFSPDSIQPGERWSDNIKHGLEGNTMGIFFIVEENIVQPWLNFEAGAISNQVGDVNVVPLLHEIEPSKITGPLTQFQAITYEKKDIKKLISLINSNLNDIIKIDTIRLNEIFEKWYPEFENEYNQFKENNKLDGAKKYTDRSNITGVLDSEGQISEILNILRSFERNRSSITKPTDLTAKELYKKNRLSNNLERFRTFRIILTDDEANLHEINNKVIELEKRLFGSLKIEEIIDSGENIEVVVSSNMNEKTLYNHMRMILSKNAICDVNVIL